MVSDIFQLLVLHQVPISMMLSNDEHSETVKVISQTRIFHL